VTRGFTNDFADALVESVVRPCMLFEGDFPSGVLRLWTGVHDVQWNGETWYAAGSLIGVPEVEETTEIVASGITVSLSGIPPELVSDVIASVTQGSIGRVYIGLLDDTGALIVDPTLAFMGRLDVPEIRDEANTATVTVTYESRAIDMGKPTPFRLTDDFQQRRFPGDRGLEYVSTLQSGKSLFWGPKR
jgi:hypothetical protein